MQQNSFQKNGLLHVNEVSTNNKYNNGNYGRRSIQEIRDDMYKAKTRNNTNNISNNNNTNNNNLLKNNGNTNNKNVDYRQRIENINNFNRWK